GRAGFHLIAKLQSRFLEGFDRLLDVSHSKNHTIPSSRFLAMPVWHWTGAGRFRTAEQNVKSSERDSRKSRQMLLFELESQVVGIERDGAAHLPPEEARARHGPRDAQ